MNTSISGSDWELVKQLFHNCLERPANERGQYLLERAASTPRIIEHVESLLAAHDDTDGFLETPAAALDGALPDSAIHGARVDRYLLIEEIGRGGMGTVYLAARDDGEFQHKVAVKLVKRGMDTDRILARFRHERQILAGLHHPNIARLLDGGTTADGRPFFVMEYVQGLAIRQYCEQHSLSVKARLALFRTVCAAVQHAHQNLVVHRDIKSSNILVTADGTPKLLDFGIAKLLGTEGDEGVTVAETLQALTPEYASPEQMRGEPVTTASDVYSLGVLLYEMLTGKRPYETQGRAEDLVRVVCNTEPDPPSEAVAALEPARVRQLRGDLDTIVLMAMRKDPRRRYQSVEHFSEDVKRHLEGQPVTARRDSVGYRTRKFVGRNRTMVAAAVLLFASLIGGITTTLWQARVARAERVRAERRFSEVRSLATSFLFELHDAIVNLPGSTPARALLVQRALTSLDGLSREAQGDVVLQRELAMAYQKVGDVQGNGYNSNLGDTRAALASYGKALQMLEDVARVSPNNAEMQFALAMNYKKIGEVLTSTGDLTQAMKQLKRSVAVHNRALSLDTSNVAVIASMAELHSEMGDTKGQEGFGNIGDIPGALADYRESVRLRQILFERMPTLVAVRVGLANSLMNLGYLRIANGDTSGRSELARSVALFEAIVADNPNDATRHLGLLSGYARLRQPLADAGDFAGALALDKRMLRDEEAMLRADPSNSFIKRTYSVAHNYLARDLRASGDPAASLSWARKALGIAQELAAADPKNGSSRHDVAFTRMCIADALADLGDNRAALAEYRSAQAEKEQLHREEPSNSRHADDLALIYIGIGSLLTRTGGLADADTNFRKAIPLAEAATQRGPQNVKAHVTLAMAYSGIGELFAKWSAVPGDGSQRLARCQESAMWLQKSMPLWRELRTRGTLPAVYRARPDLVEHEIQRC